MNIAEQERDLFAAFGSLPERDSETSPPHVPQNSPLAIDLSPPEPANESRAPVGDRAPSARGPQKLEDVRTFDLNFPIAEPAAAGAFAPPLRDPFETAPELALPSPPKTGFSWSAFGGGASALAWTGAAIGGPISYYGLEAVLAMDPAMQAALIALGVGPSLLFWLTGVAAGEAAKARRLADHVARMAHDAIAPLAAGETQAQRLSHAVQSEIEAMNDAVAGALARLGEFETVARRQAAVFDAAIAATRENADHLSESLSREREALAELNGDLRGQTETMTHSIGRQVRLMREASKLVKSEIGAAESALQHHLHAFGAAAATMNERTSAVSHAADAAQAASHAANDAMSEVLHGLGQATKLTDTARQSAQQAALAANETASAVRETTQRAIGDAKRAAQLIRAETVALQDAAGETLQRLAAAADAARQASEHSQAAADRHASAIEKRLTAFAAAAQGARQTPTRNDAPAERAPRSKSAPTAPGNLFAAATAASKPTREHSERISGRGGWSNLFPNGRNDVANEDLEENDAFALMDFEPTPRDPDADLKSDALDLCAAAGVDLADALSQGDLDRIAQRARHGALARREAVGDAAPGSVNRLMRHFARSAEAKRVAAAFRARPDLASSQAYGEGLNLVRAYLLIDSALD